VGYWDANWTRDADGSRRRFTAQSSPNAVQRSSNRGRRRDALLAHSSRSLLRGDAARILLLSAATPRLASSLNASSPRPHWIRSSMAGAVVDLSSSPLRQAGRNWTNLYMQLLPIKGLVLGRCKHDGGPASRYLACSRLLFAASRRGRPLRISNLPRGAGGSAPGLSHTLAASMA